MEGLIPMVYKAMKRNRARGQYRCLSSSSASASATAAAMSRTTYNIADFYVDHSHQTSYVYVPPAASTPALADYSSSTNINNGINGQEVQHRRHKSLSVSAACAGKDNYYNNYDNAFRGRGFSSHNSVGEATRDSPPHPPPKQLVRFRSHRIFSCITGA